MTGLVEVLSVGLAQLNAAMCWIKANVLELENSGGSSNQSHGVTVWVPASGMLMVGDVDEVRAGD